MYHFSPQCDIMGVVRKSWGDHGTFPLSFDLPDDSEVPEPFARVFQVGSHQISPVHFTEELSFDVWLSGDNSRSKVFEACAELYGHVMGLPQDVDSPVTFCEPVAAIQVYTCPELEIPRGTFTIRVTTTNERF